MLGMRRGLPSRRMRRRRVAQDLRADAVGAQVHLAAAARRDGSAACRCGSQRPRVSPQFSSTATPRGLRLQRRQRLRQRPRMLRTGRRRAGRAPTAARARAPAPRRRRSTGPCVSARCRPPVRSRKAMQSNAPCGVLQRALADALDQRLVAAAVLDQVGDGADLQAVLLREHAPGRAGAPSCRRRFITSQITAAGVSPAMRGQVAAGFGVAGAHQHAAVLRLQREDVAGLHQVARRVRRAPRRPARCARGRRPRCRW